MRSTPAEPPSFESGSRLRRFVWAAGAPARAALSVMVTAYRRTFRGSMSGRCRFHPTCSSYALEAVRHRGALVGGVLAVWRVLRCNPLSRGGLDPVPGRRAAPEYDGVIHPAGPTQEQVA